MNQKLKKIISCLSITVMTALSLTACDKKSNDSNTTSQSGNSNEVMGRYVESDISLPDNDTQYIQMGKTEENNPYLIGTKESDNSIQFLKYTLINNNEWSQEMIGEFSNEDSTEAPYGGEYFTDANGNEYVHYSTSIEQSAYDYFLKKTGDTWELLQVEGWNEYDKEDEYYKTPWSIGVLDNGNIIANFDCDLNLYDSETGKLIKTLDFSQQNGYDNFNFFGNEIVFLQMDLSTYTPENVCIYNVETDELQKIPYPDTLVDDYNLYLNQDSDLYLVNTDGIHLYKNGTSLWQVIVDGSLTSLYLPTLGVISFMDTPDNDFYLLCYIGDTIHLLKYSFDETVAAIPNQELSIYSLSDNPLIRQAIVSFQQSHPDVKVTLNVTMEYETESVKTEYIRALNTSLLAGGGEDILILDGLPFESYQEKGVLVDLSDILQPMIDSGELLTNVMENFKMNDSYYYAPTKMKLLMLYGNADSATQCNTLTDIIDYGKAHTERSVLGEISSSELIDTFVPVYLSTLKNADGTLSETAITDLFTKLKELLDITGGFSAINEPDKSNDAYFNIYSLPKDIIMNLSYSYGMLDETFNLEMVDFIEGSFSNFENAFEPVGLVGINSSSKQIDLAKEFVQLLYSNDVQSLDFLDGYPVNTSIIEQMVDSTFEPAYTDIEDANGNYVPFVINDASPEQKQAIINLCKTADNCIIQDDTMLTAISDAAEDYLADNVSLEDAVSNLMNELSLYTEE